MNTSLISLLETYAMTVPSLNFDERHRHLITKSVDFDIDLYDMAVGNLEMVQNERRETTRVHKDISKIRIQRDMRWVPRCCSRLLIKEDDDDDDSSNNFQPASCDPGYPSSSASSSAAVLKPAPNIVGSAMVSERRDSAVSKASSVESENATAAASPAGADRQEVRGTNNIKASSPEDKLSRQGGQFVASPAPRECEHDAFLVPVRIASPSREAGQNASPLLSREAGQNTSPLPVAAAGAVRERGQISPSMQPALQNAGREVGQTAAMLSAADESAGREREQSTALLPANHGESGGHWVCHRRHHSRVSHC